LRQNPLRRRWPPAGHTTAAGSGGRRAPFSTDIASYTHTARSLACSAPILPRHFQVRWCARLPPPRVLLKHARGMDGFCNHNADQLGSLAGLSLLTVYVVECAPASPCTYSSSTHRFPDERAHLSRLRLFQRHLRSLVRVWVWVWVHTFPRTLLHTLPFFLPPSFHTTWLGPKSSVTALHGRFCSRITKWRASLPWSWSRAFAKQIEPFESLPTGEGMDTLFIAAVDRGAMKMVIRPFFGSWSLNEPV
jgi:hypothetical protein